MCALRMSLASCAFDVWMIVFICMWMPEGFIGTLMFGVSVIRGYSSDIVIITGLMA